MLSADELSKIIDDVIKSESSLIKDRGIGAVGALMGIVMSKTRGKVDAKIVAERIKEKVEAIVASG
jgi:glutamyl-tRNA(Gln) amidotransferase subunit E